MLDIDLFRKDKGGNPDLIVQSQKKRFADVTLVDKVIETDTKWRKMRGRVDILNKYVGMCSKVIGKKMKDKEPVGNNTDPIPDPFLGKSDDNCGLFLDALLADKQQSEDTLSKLNVEQLKKVSTHISGILDQLKKQCDELETQRDKYLVLIGNIVHDSVVVSDDEANNGIVRTYEGESKKHLEQQNLPTLLNHVELMKKMGCMSTEEGAVTAGNRAYFLLGHLVRLNFALIQYGIDFLETRGYTPIYPPYFMNKSIMGEVAQLEQFDEELYKVTGEGEDKYLIATSEQPICAYHRDKWFDDKQLPIRYVGYSACFRKEVGSHGKDTLGIFRVHQFEKIEQFLVTSPKDDISWKAMESMINNSEEFYQSLGLSYQVVNIVSGKLNNAASKKLDLEAWFPASKTYRELVSCSNCTDYQSRHLNTRYGQSKKSQGGDKEYVHMLNATLCATSRTMCCIVENYQTKDGIVIPPVLRKYLGGKEFIPFAQDGPKAKK